MKHFSKLDDPLQNVYQIFVALNLADANYACPTMFYNPVFGIKIQFFLSYMVEPIFLYTTEPIFNFVCLLIVHVGR